MLKRRCMILNDFQLCNSHYLFSLTTINIIRVFHFITFLPKVKNGLACSELKNLSWQSLIGDEQYLIFSMGNLQLTHFSFELLDTLERKFPLKILRKK